MSAVRIAGLICLILVFTSGINAQEERRVSFNLFGGVSLIPGNERINKSGQVENIFGSYPIAPMAGLGVNYRFNEKMTLVNNAFAFTTAKKHFSFHNIGIRSSLRYYPLTDKCRLAPFVSGGLNLNLATIDRREYSENIFPDPNSTSIGPGISVSQINYNYEKLNLAFLPMPGVSVGAGVSYKLTPKLSVFAEYNYNYNLANLSSLMKEHYFANKANLVYHFASAGITFKLLKPRKQLLATLTKDAWDGDLTVTVKGSLVYKNPNKKSDKTQNVEIDDIKDTLVAVLPTPSQGDFEYKNLRADDYKFYLQKNNRKVIRADIQVIHDNRKVDIFDDYPALELIDDYESSNIISRDNNFSVILREGFQHEVDITVIADNVIGKVTPFSSDSLCRNMLVLLKNKQDSILAVTKPNDDCGYHFDNVVPGQYKVVFVRDTMPGNIHFGYEFTENPPVIQRQYNTEEDDSFYELYATAEVYEEYDAMDVNQILLYDRVEQVVALDGNVNGNENRISGNNSDRPMNGNMGDKPVDYNVLESDPVDLSGNKGSKNGSTVNSDKVLRSGEKAGKKYALNQLNAGYTYNPNGEKVQPTGYGVQVAAFKSLENLNHYLNKQKKTPSDMIFIQVLDGSENDFHVKIYRVIMGDYSDINDAKKEAKKLKSSGYETVIRKHRSVKVFDN